MSATVTPLTADWSPEGARVDVVRRAACEISEIAELLADGIYDQHASGEVRLTQRLVRTLAQRVYVLGNAVLRAIDEDDAATSVAGEVFPAKCVCIGGSGD